MQERSIDEIAPSTVKEVGIHIAYLRQDINDLKDLVKDLSGVYVTTDRFQGIEERVEELEKGIRWGVGVVLVAVITTILQATHIIK